MFSCDAKVRFSKCTVGCKNIQPPENFPIECYSKQVVQNFVLWKENASHFSMYDAKSRFRTSPKSIVKDYYIRSAFFILEMGSKSLISLHPPTPIEI